MGGDRRGEIGDRLAVEPVRGSSSSHSAAGLATSRASARRRRCPAESSRHGQSASALQARTARAPRQHRAPPRIPGPEAQRLRHGQHRLHRIVMADEMQPRAMGGGVALSGSPSQARRPASGRLSPAISRSRLDLPLPLGPVSTSAPPGRQREIEPGEDQPLAAPAGEARPAKPRTAEGSGAKERACRQDGGEVRAIMPRRGALRAAPPPKRRRPRWGDNRGRLMKRSGKTAAMDADEPISVLRPMSRRPDCAAIRSKSWRNGDLCIAGAQPPIPAGDTPNRIS